MKANDIKRYDPVKQFKTLKLYYLQMYKKEPLSVDNLNDYLRELEVCLQMKNNEADKEAFEMKIFYLKMIYDYCIQNTVVFDIPLDQPYKNIPALVKAYDNLTTSPYFQKLGDAVQKNIILKKQILNEKYYIFIKAEDKAPILLN